ncbi:MAG: hypothetical protein IJ327_00810 [Lachnospiraceae bacterium]|nr:hypothetical protein [Lachnospiraceae bacterium]
MSRAKKKHGSRIIYFIIAAIFIYIIVQSFFLAKSSKSGYVVAEKGDLQDIEEYTGVITRQEQVIRASQGGVVEYYYPGNRHLSKGTLVCSLRDNYYGDLLEQKMDDLYQQMLNEASSTEYAEDFKKLDEDISQQLAEYVRRKNSSEYESVYTLKNSVKATMDQRDNLLAILQNYSINAMLKEQGIYTEQMEEQSVSVWLPTAGMISYTYDAYEGWTWEQVKSDFTENYDGTYETITLNLQEIEKDAPLYRLVTSQSWNITLFVDAEKADNFEVEDKVAFYIDMDNMEGTVIHKEQAGEQFKVVLEVSEALADYANTRVARLKFTYSGEEGIKIPQECILEKSFYKVQEKYIYHSGSQASLMIRYEDKDAMCPIQIVYEEELEEGAQEGTQYVYFELPDGLEEGALMIEEGTTKVAPLSETGVLPYVYTINGGYQVMEIVEIEYQSDRYAIVNEIKLYDRVLIP